VEGVLRGARIAAEWIPAPTAEDIRVKDRERLLQTLLEPVEADDEDRELGAMLLAQRSPQEVAAALVRAHRAALPAPEELLGQAAGPQGGERGQGPRAGFEDTIWFRINVGRRHNADPRWLLPLLCRRGHITKNEVGAIRIAAGETMFEIPRTAAGRFVKALARTAGEEDDGIAIEQVQGSPREAARENRRAGPRPVLHKATPHRGAGPRRQPGR
jgi:ATP-dependent RNA helicase DeaD